MRCTLPVNWKARYCFRKGTLIEVNERDDSGSDILSLHLPRYVLILNFFKFVLCVPRMTSILMILITMVICFASLMQYNLLTVRTMYSSVKKSTVTWQEKRNQTVCSYRIFGGFASSLFSSPLHRRHLYWMLKLSNKNILPYWRNKLQRPFKCVALSFQNDCFSPWLCFGTGEPETLIRNLRKLPSVPWLIRDPSLKVHHDQAVRYSKDWSYFSKSITILKI
jgi:hypothetical protein